VHHFLAKGVAPVRDLEHKADRKDLTSNRRPRRRPILEREREREIERERERERLLGGRKRWIEGGRRLADGGTQIEIK